MAKSPSINPIRSSNCWGCKVKLADKSRFAVSLRVPWPGNVREAEARAAELQAEIDAGKLDQSLRWLGEKSAETLKFKLGLQAVEEGVALSVADPKTWWDARAAWLATYPDRKADPNKVSDLDFTKRGYASRTKLFCEWADEAGVALKGKSATTVALMFLRARRSGGNAASEKGVSLGSLDHDIRVLFTWFGWLKRKGIRDQLDKEAVYDDPIFASEEDAGQNFIPDWRLDLASLKKMHETRFDSPAATAAWRLYVLVRGIGCRPKEAYTLSWDTCHLDEGIIVFKSTKEQKIKSSRQGRGARSRRAVKDRHVPIVYQWVLDALLELRSLGVRKGSAVATRPDGDPHQGPGQVSNSFGRHLKAIGLRREGYDLKACQRAGLVHLEQVLPPWVVARIAGHSLDVHMARYSTNTSHLPTTKARDYGTFDVLSFAGQEVAAKHQQSSMLRDLMGKGEL